MLAINPSRTAIRQKKIEERSQKPFSMYLHTERRDTCATRRKKPLVTLNESEHNVSTDYINEQPVLPETTPSQLMTAESKKNDEEFKTFSSVRPNAKHLRKRYSKGKQQYETTPVDATTATASNSAKEIFHVMQLRKPMQSLELYEGADIELINEEYRRNSIKRKIDRLELKTMWKHERSTSRANDT